VSNTDISEPIFRFVCGNLTFASAFSFAVEELMEANMGRGILLWLLGVPIPVIILLWLFFGR
jgi:hypothetical protein